MSNQASPKPSKHVCSDCGRIYKAAETLNRHRKNHQENTAYRCTICSASFKRKDLLDRHSQIHIGGRPVTARNRSTRACDRCSRLKTRCDNLSPCARCDRGGHDCSYQHIRSRARTDRSSASVSSSVRSSPQLQAEDMFSVAIGSHLPSQQLPLSLAPGCSSPATFTDTIWAQEPAWQWPEDAAANEQYSGETLHHPAIPTQYIPAYAQWSSTVCATEQDSNIAIDDSCGGMSWYQGLATHPNTYFNDTSLDDHMRRAAQYQYTSG